MTNYKTFLSLFLSTILLVFVSACTAVKKPNEKSPIKLDLLVTSQWLSEHLSDPNLVILDTTVLIKMGAEGGFSMESGRENYEKEHIPSAGFADLLVNLSASDTPLKFVMPNAEQFSQAIGALGIGNDSLVVLYSTDNMSWPARLWWMLRWAGLENVAILDGGLKVWKQEGRPLSVQPANHAKKLFTINLHPEMIADQKEVSAAINDAQVDIVDTMSEVHYLGQFSMYKRAGHITSATNLDSSKVVDETGRFIAKDELKSLFENNQNNRIITYCGGGVAASSVAFALVNAGFKDVAVYMGSLQEWTANPDNPMEGESAIDW